jgi:hypothetical protein
MGKNTTQAFKSLYNTEGMETLGWIVHYRAGEFEIPVQEFQDLLKKNSIEPKMAPKVLDHNAAKRTAKELTRRRAKEKGVQVNQVIYKEVSGNNKTETVIQIIDLQVDSEDQDVSLGQKTNIVFDKGTRTISLRDGDPKDEQIVKDVYDKVRVSITEDQFRNFAKKYLAAECKSINVRQEGGIFFVPANKRDELDKLQAVFSATPDASLMEIPIIDTKDARNSMWSSMTSQVESDLASMATAFDKDKDNLTDRELKTKLKDYTELRNKVALYEMVLRDNADAINSKLQTLETAIKTKLGV